MPCYLLKSDALRFTRDHAMLSFQQVILRLQDYWDRQGCALLQPYDMEVGAGTSHTATFLRALGPEPWRAAYVQREYTTRNPRGFVGYGQDCWGLSAGDGPSAQPRLVNGRYQAFYGYAARGVPYGPDDGTICGPSTLSSLVFAPEIALPAIRNMLAMGSCDAGTRVQASGFNPTVTEAGPNGWTCEGAFGLDQGMVVMTIENFRTGLFWKLGRANRFIREGLRRADFTGGWL